MSDTDTPALVVCDTAVRRCACDSTDLIVWSAGSGLCGPCNEKRNDRADRRLGFADNSSES